MEVRGRRHWERLEIDAPWVLDNEQWDNPRSGSSIDKVVNVLNPDGSTKTQEVYFKIRLLPEFQECAVSYAADGSRIFTMLRKLVSNRTMVVRYIRSDQSPICEMQTFEDHFKVFQFHRDGSIDETSEFPYSDENHLIEHFERDGEKITFESMSILRDDNNEVKEYRNETRRWIYMLSEDGKRIKRMYKNGSFQRDRYVETVYDQVKFEFVFD